jgi:hypothetical protein
VCGLPILIGQGKFGYGLSNGQHCDLLCKTGCCLNND